MSYLDKMFIVIFLLNIHSVSPDPISKLSKMMWDLAYQIFNKNL